MKSLLSSIGIFFTAAGVPWYEPRYTVPNDPDPTTESVLNLMRPSSTYGTRGMYAEKKQKSQM